MKPVTDYLDCTPASEKPKRKISNRYIPVNNHVVFLRNMAPYRSVLIRPTEDNIGFEAVSSNFGNRDFIDRWLAINLNGGSTYRSADIVSWAVTNKYDGWLRTISPSDIRIVFWPRDIEKYPYKEDSEQLWKY